MTQITDSYKQLFDKLIVTTSVGTWSIFETDPGSTFNKVDLIAPNLSFENYDSKGFLAKPNIFDENVTTKLQNSDCDGFSIAEDDKGSKFIFLTELKSKYNTDNLEKAYRQLIFSFLKAYELLSLCRGFDLDEFDVMMFICCHNAEKDKLTEVKSVAEKSHQLMQDKGTCTFKGKCLPLLVYNGELKTKFGQLPFLNDLELTDKIKAKDVRIKLVTGVDHLTPYAKCNLSI